MSAKWVKSKRDPEAPDLVEYRLRLGKETLITIWRYPSWETWLVAHDVLGDEQGQHEEGSLAEVQARALAQLAERTQKELDKLGRVQAFLSEVRR